MQMSDIDSHSLNAGNMCTWTLTGTGSFISKKEKDCFYSKNIKTEFHFHPPNAPLSNPFFSQNIFLKFKVGIVSLRFFISTVDNI